ncbi:MAG: hypothetical protein K2Q10_10275 [Rhodospirillales bacterium]|nr:hypothetical protein [Rhodospirillales bacterium]
MLITLAIGALLVVGGGLVTYMASLVKSAYAIRVEIRTEMDEGMRRIEDDMDKKSRWIKRDLIEEMEKTRNALNTENQRRAGEMAEVLNKRLVEMDTAYRNDRIEILKLLDNQRQMILSLDQRLRALKREQRRADMGAVLESMAPAGGDNTEPADTEVQAYGGEEQSAPAA